MEDDGLPEDVKANAQAFFDAGDQQPPEAGDKDVAPDTTSAKPGGGGELRDSTATNSTSGQGGVVAQPAREAEGSNAAEMWMFGEGSE